MSRKNFLLGNISSLHGELARIDSLTFASQSFVNERGEERKLTLKAVGPIGICAAILGVSVWAMAEMGLSPMEMTKAFGHGFWQAIRF